MKCLLLIFAKRYLKMDAAQKLLFFNRIDALNENQKPSFGVMNANQMICHLTDQIRMALGTKMALEKSNIDPKQIIAMAKAGKSIKAAKGFGQVEGEGTKPTFFENDKMILKEHITDFLNLPDDFSYASHALLGDLDKKRWHGLLVYHLNHHLGQFEV